MPESTVNLHACRRCGSVYSVEYTRECPQCKKDGLADLIRRQVIGGSDHGFN